MAPPPSAAILGLFRPDVVENDLDGVPGSAEGGNALRQRVRSDDNRAAIIAEYRKIYQKLGAARRFPELQ